MTIKHKKTNYMKITTRSDYPAFALFALICFGVSWQARADCQEGCLTNGNTVLGFDALASNTGFNNTATGAFALQRNTGSSNTACGTAALFSNTYGDFNTAVGSSAMKSNTLGTSNTAIGVQALQFNTRGYSNTASGERALRSNTVGTNNTATGSVALYSNTTGSFNSATGEYALFFNTTGSSNTACGVATLSDNTTGNYNTAFGDEALRVSTTADENTAVGYVALRNTTGAGNIGLGALAGINLTTGNNNIDIGSQGKAGEADTIRLGDRALHTATYIAGINGATVPKGVAVIIDADGHLGTITSSARYKERIQPINKASEAILALKPVTFHYKKEYDPEGIPQFGLVAEEVEKVNSDLVVRDEDGNPYSVRYEAVNAMLLNEFIKEHRKVEQQRKDFEAALARQQRQIEELTAGLQKMGAQLEVNKRAAQAIVNNEAAMR
jgi:hypothetical protein